jgi:hypothetical protein
MSTKDLVMLCTYTDFPGTVYCDDIAIMTDNNEDIHESDIR